MRNRSGFTFIELLIIVVLIGVIASIAIPRFSSNQRTAYTTVRKIVSDLRYTRGLAISSGEEYYLQFVQVSGLYRQYIIRDSSDQPVPGIEIRIIPDNVTCTLTTDKFTFDYLGVCNSGSGTDTVTLNDGFETSSVIVVDMTGRASY